MPRVRNKWVHG